MIRSVFTTVLFLCLSPVVSGQSAIKVDSIRALAGVMDVYPAVSPDGSKILFHSNRMGNNDIYIMNFDGSDLRQLTTNAANDRTPSWSPDGMHIAFVSTRDGNYNIFIMNKDGSSQRNLTNNSRQKDIHPSWSPDGNFILFNSSRVNDTYQLFVMDRDGSNQHTIRKNAGEATHAQFSADGKRIIFRKFVEMEGNNSDVFMVNADGSNEKRLTNSPSTDYAPAWSPGGESIVFVSDQGIGREALFILNTSTLAITQLTWPKAGEQHMTPVWIEGNKILYSHLSGSTCVISLIDLAAN